MVDPMEIVPKQPGKFLLRFILLFLLLAGIWSFIATPYAFFKMHVLQWAVRVFFEHPPFIRDPGFLQGYAVSVLILAALSLARWSRDNFHQWKKYPWFSAVFLVVLLIIIDIAGSLLEISAQRSTSFILNYTVTWLLSVGTVALPFLAWFYLESRIKSAS